MKSTPTPLAGVMLIEPRVFGDERGEFYEAWQRERYREAGIKAEFVQSNVSRSTRGVVRGLHYQWPRPQGKLVSVVQGAVFDVAVDIRPQSPAFRHWFGAELNADNHHQLYIPPGYAHGFQALSDDVIFTYLCTDIYYPAGDRVLAWNDDTIAVEWPLAVTSLSPKDAAAPRLSDVSPEHLPPLQPC